MRELMMIIERKLAAQHMFDARREFVQRPHHFAIATLRIQLARLTNMNMMRVMPLVAMNRIFRIQINIKCSTKCMRILANRNAFRTLSNRRQIFIAHRAAFLAAISRTKVRAIIHPIMSILLMMLMRCIWIIRTTTTTATTRTIWCRFPFLFLTPTTTIAKLLLWSMSDSRMQRHRRHTVRHVKLDNDIATHTLYRILGANL
mmetsp:Transcript_50511/g.84059  ORF Transcript_50511/g.84059 Transcript_50511/m.84059 type:complete len:202 (-) Transcript_50511:619-1224(-)